MTQIKGEAKIQQMIEMIKKEAKEEADEIIRDAKLRVQKERNKTYNQMYDQLVVDFNERESNENTQRRLELSRRTNESRLDVQKHRSSLLDELKHDTETKLKATISNKKVYKELLRKLLLEGAVRLIESDIQILCREEDVSLIKEIIADAEKDFQEFMRNNMNKEYTTKFTIIDKKFMEKEEIGGVILYCNRFKTVLNNSLKSRLELTFESSIPDVRRKLFSNKPAKN